MNNQIASKNFGQYNKSASPLDLSIDRNAHVTIPINTNLVWDYDIPPETERCEAFYRWYIARVLQRGNSQDLKAIGFETIAAYLPTLNLPAKIRAFWEWYFSSSNLGQHYGAT